LLSRGSNVVNDVLRFLPHSIDDLYARDALLAAGSVRVDEFRAALPEAIRLTTPRNLFPLRS
jgi:hypothetical protein